METDKRLGTLIEEFSSLKEDEKEYILEISEGLIQSISAKANDAHKPNICRNNLFYGGMK